MTKCTTCGAPVNLAPDGDPKYAPPRSYRQAYLDKCAEVDAAIERIFFVEEANSNLQDQVNELREALKRAHDDLLTASIHSNIELMFEHINAAEKEIRQALGENNDKTG